MSNKSDTSRAARSLQSQRSSALIADAVDRQPQQRGLSCGHVWYGQAWDRCPKCGDVAAETAASKGPTENNPCIPENNSVRIRREIDESIRNLTREIIRLRRLKEVV